MLRLFSRVGVCVLLFSFLAVSIGAAPVLAVPTYTFTADSTNPDITSFKLTFVDELGNGLFSTGDPFTFITAPVLYPSTYKVPALGIQQIPEKNLNPSDPDGGYSPLTYDKFGGNLWVFYCNPSLPPYYSSTFNMWPASFTESIKPVGTPIPPSALLLVSGLIPLAWARRKKRLGE